MEINNIIIREYIESLTEKNELNKIFVILLEALNFNILTKPTENIGIKEYGKDIVAVGIDQDRIKKKFFFELKGGSARNITEANFHGKDGIAESLTEATYVPFLSAYPQFENLPLKVVIVHNGIVEGKVKDVLEGILSSFAKNNPDKEYDRWDIDRLSKLFSHNLFSKYLLTDEYATKLFNRVLINLNSSELVTVDFIKLIELLLNSTIAQEVNIKLSRLQEMKLQSIRLVAFIIYTESRNQYDNLEIAKKYIASLIVQYWGWVLINKLEGNKSIIKHFKSCLDIFYDILNEYYLKTLPFATGEDDGLSNMKAGRYEQAGYTFRTFEYIQYLHITIKLHFYYNSQINIEKYRHILYDVMMKNRVISRPLIDIHSIPICLNLLYFLELNDKVSAKNYLWDVCNSICEIKIYHDRIPDASNSVENVIKFIVNREKPYFYSDTTSLLINMLMEFIYILDMENLFLLMKDLILKYNIKLGLFIPHQRENSSSMNLCENPNLDLEEKLFTQPMTDGFQDELRLYKLAPNKLDANLTYQEFREKISRRKDDFNYEYRTEKVGFGFLLDLAHGHFQTPYFPNKWRVLF